MNKRCYRIIFNQKRGQLMAVAESAASQGKSTADSRSETRTGVPLVATLRHLTWRCLAAFGLVLALGSAQAQIVAYKNAPAGQAPTVLSTGNGVPLVNIRTPNASGLSHNSYTQFDVAANGAILNNSPDNVQTQLGGWVQGNPWLATGSARVILNEVFSNNPSTLNGYIEVAGQRAQVIIANPSGISCNGCGFINANRATLTTGVPVISGNGNLDSYRVQGGQITIGGAGLDASTADYTDLIARAVQINAGLWTKQLNVMTGVNQVDAAVSTATPISGTGTVPAYAIDVAALGGMYAQKIVLVGTEAGVGVRNAGNINASVGDVVVTAAGRLENSKTISATGNLQASTQGDITNSGTLYAQGNTGLTTQGNLDNTGVIAAAGNTTLAATGTSSTLTSHAGSVLGAGVQSNGTLGSSGNLTVSATQSVTAVGQNLSGGDQSLTSLTVDLSASQTSARNLTISATAGDVTLTGASLAVSGTATLGATQTICTDTATVVADTLNLNARDLSNRQGTLYSASALSATLTNALDNRQGTLSSAGTLDVQDAQPANKILAITNTAGSIVAGTSATLDVASLTGDGKLASNGDLSVKLTQDYTHTGIFSAQGNARLETTGKVTNQTTLQAGDTLTVKAADVDNQATGTIQGNKLALHASNTFTNRGLIDSQETVIDAGTLSNLGTGRIYGDHVALSANTLTNDVENGTAPVIAARDRLDLGVGTLNNREHALIFSAGDLALGRSLDANKQATGQADALNNNSATIESLGAMDLNVKVISNTNDHFSTALQTISTESITEYQGSGSATRYVAGTPGVYVYNDESDHLMTPEGSFETWSAYHYTRTIQEDRVTSSDPAKILSGGGMRITSDALTNDKSQIIAGGTLSGTIGTLTNTEVPGQHIVTDAGSVTNYWRNHKKGRDDTGSSSAAYAPPSVIQSISLTPTVYQQNTAPGGSGTQIATLSNSVGTQTIGQNGNVNVTLPNNSLYRTNPNPNSHVLIETDPRFANYRTWLSSDYMLQALSYDPATTQKRLGDGFYEQRLIREQIGQLTGHRFLDGYASDEAEFRALMDNGVTVGKAWNLRPGVALTAAQVAQLTSDIVWLVEQTVTLPDGTTTKVLVPQVYVRVREGDLATAGALIAGQDVQLDIRGDLINQGSIAGRDVVSLTADNLKNLGGRIQGIDTRVEARNDLLNLGGSITGADSLSARAGHDLTVESATRTQTNANGSRTNIDRVAGLYVTGSNGILVASAGNNLNLNAAAVQSQGSATLAAGNNVNFGTATEASSNQITWDGSNRRSDRTTTEVGTVVRSQGNGQILAGQDINARAASVTSDQGAVSALAGRDINLSAGQSTAQVDEAHQHTSQGFLNSTTRSTRDTLNESTAIGSTFSGNTVNVAANRDVTVQGSNVISTAGTQVSAGNNLTIEAATNTREEEHLSKKTTSGLMSSGFGFTIGTRMQSTDGKGVSTAAAGSTVGSTDGNVALQAGEKYVQKGSDVLAPKGDIAIAAKQVDIVEARETTHNETETKFNQSGLTIALTSPVITAIQTGQQMNKASKQTSDDRMKVLAAANTGMAAASAASAVQDAGSAAGGINLAISIGGSQSKSKTVQSSDSGRGSTVNAGGDVAIVATGAGQGSNLTIQGSDVKAGNNVLLAADNDINLLAGKNTADQKSTNSSISGSVGISIGTSGFGVTVSASGARGKADGNDVTYSNTHVEAGNKLTLESGGDTTVRGAVARAEQIQADIGGNLKVESLQDTSHFESKQQSIGASVTIGAGVSGSVSASSSKTKSDYANVAEQSGFKAGDGGFQVNVKGDTDLKGGAITSTDKAVQENQNTFTTGGQLTTSDIQNSANYSAKSIGATVGTSQANDGTFKPAGNSAGIGSDKGSASSTTQAAISGIAGNTAARTGDAETGINKIFDADKVQKDIDAQVLITRTFGAQASKAVGDYAKTQLDAAAQLKADAVKESDPDRKAQLEQQAQQIESDWGDNGTKRVLAHTVIGGLTGGVAGAAGTATGTLTAPAVADALKAAGIDGPLATALTGIASTAAGMAVGGTAGAMGSFNEVTNNYLDHKRPTMMRLSEKERYENAVAACDQGNTDACRTKAELALLSYQRDLALAQACSGTTPDLCNQKAREAIAMGNIVQGSNGQFVYANSPESGPVRYLNTATVGTPTRPDNFQDQVAKSTSEALLLEGQNALIGAVLSASFKGVAATNAAVKDFFAANGTIVGDDVATRIALNFSKDGDRFTAVAENMAAAKNADWITSEGRTWWPPGNGAVPGTEFQTVLPVGTKLDRYGAINANTDFLAPAGTPLAQRALPANSAGAPLVQLEVVKPLPVQQSNVMPWFGEPGMGIQYQTTSGELSATVEKLISSGYLRIVK